MFLTDLLLLEIQGYDVILGMDWLTKHKVTIDCEQKLLSLVTPKGERLVQKGMKPTQAIPLISATRAFMLLKRATQHTGVQSKQQKLRSLILERSL